MRRWESCRARAFPVLTAATASRWEGFGRKLACSERPLDSCTSAEVTAVEGDREIRITQRGGRGRVKPRHCKERTHVRNDVANAGSTRSKLSIAMDLGREVMLTYIAGKGEGTDLAKHGSWRDLENVGQKV